MSLRRILDFYFADFAEAPGVKNDQPRPSELIVTYEDKLQDPRWHEFRAQVLEDGNYQCRRCRRYENEVPLQVHHPFYRRGREPWDYDVWDVECLCVGCHRKAHGIANPSDDEVPF